MVEKDAKNKRFNKRRRSSDSRQSKLKNEGLNSSPKGKSGSKSQSKRRRNSFLKLSLPEVILRRFSLSKSNGTELFKKPIDEKMNKRKSKRLEIKQLMKKLKKLNDKDRKLRAISLKTDESERRHSSRRSDKTNSADTLETIPFNELNERMLKRTEHKLLIKVIKSIESSKSNESERPKIKEKKRQLPIDMSIKSASRSKSRKLQFKLIEIREFPSVEQSTSNGEIPKIDVNSIPAINEQANVTPKRELVREIKYRVNVKEKLPIEKKSEEIRIEKSISPIELPRMSSSKSIESITAKKSESPKSIESRKSESPESIELKANDLKSVFVKSISMQPVRLKTVLLKNATESKSNCTPVKMRSKEKSKSERDCRICLQAIDDEPNQIRPCACAGSQAYVHRNCIHEWIRIRGLNKCDICHQEYTGLNLIKKRKGFLSWMTSSPLVMLSFVTFIIVSYITFYILFLAYLEYRTSNGFANQLVRIFLLVILILFVLLFAISLIIFTCKTAFMFVVWRRSNYSVILPDIALLPGTAGNPTNQPTIVQVPGTRDTKISSAKSTSEIFTNPVFMV